MSLSDLAELLKETSVYQELWHQGYEEGFREGYAKGCQEAKQEALQNLSEALHAIVEARFPALFPQSRAFTEVARNTDALVDMLIGVGGASTYEQAEKALLKGLQATQR